MPIFKKSSDIYTSTKDKVSSDAPLQDNYEEVEMDIDSDPGSPGININSYYLAPDSM